MLYVVVDGANVMGSRPNGWWRDRAAAAQRLAESLDATLRRAAVAFAAGIGRRHRSAPSAAGDLRVLLVLEGAAKAADPRVTDPRLTIVRAPGEGESTIAELARELAGRGEDVVVVTADRRLRDLVHRAGARTVGPSVLLRLLVARRSGASPRRGRGFAMRRRRRRSWYSRRARQPARRTDRSLPGGHERGAPGPHG